ncbi:MAG: hypothetical protein GVY29_08450 [Spirochaetes bacterium]|jgi:DNA-binding CsgD family transcriptional regulator|nr:hypothetical protein [Spirochaetota bacterium]
MSRSGQPHVFEILELAYRIDLPKRTWMQQLADRIHRRRGIGPGVLAYELDISEPDGPGELGCVAATGEIEGFAQNTEPLHRSLSTRVYHRVLQCGTHCSTIRTCLKSLGTSLEEYPLVEDMIRDAGADDIWAVSTVNPDARTLTFSIPLRHSYGPPRLETEFWGKVGTHIAAGHRLRRRMAEAPPESRAAAIMRPDGRALELGDDARPHRDVLRRTVRALDSAKARDFRTGSSETIDLWKGLLAGEWSLVDRVDTDGKRYVLAIRNDPDAPAPVSLSRREAQVATYIAQGRSHKAVSYELGIAVSTVGTHLRNALDKLGLSSHTELAWFYGAVRAESR